MSEVKSLRRPAPLWWSNTRQERLGPFLGWAACNIGFYIAFVAGALLLFLQKGTAVNVITQFTFAVGLAYLVLVVMLVQWENGESSDSRKHAFCWCHSARPRTLSLLLLYTSKIPRRIQNEP